MTRPKQTSLPPAAARQGRAYRLWVDRQARRLVSVGGLIIIGAILAILIVIVIEVLPLFEAPRADRRAEFAAPTSGEPLAVGVDEHQSVAFLATRKELLFLALSDGRAISNEPLPGGVEASAASAVREGRFALGLSDGRVLPARVSFDVSFPEGVAGGRVVEPRTQWGEPLRLFPDARPVEVLGYRSGEEGMLVAGVGEGGVLHLLEVRERRALLGPSVREEYRHRLALPLEGETRALVFDERRQDLFIATQQGQLLRVSLRGEDPQFAEDIVVPGRLGVAITAMAFLLGDVTLAVGDADGGVSTWQLVRSEEGPQRLTQMHRFEPHRGPVTAVAPCRRNKGFLAADASGRVLLRYGTTGQTLRGVDTSPLALLAYAPKGDAFVTVGAGGRIGHWTLGNEHPEITWRALFGRLWYEGYGQPEYVWQSSGGSDDFEPKYSLTPLLVGTLKGTFYALLFAVPLALLAALYASQFIHPRLKGYLKPTVEIMAALPSVVLGFLAGLWLAPLLEKVAPGVFLLFLVLPVVIFLALLLWLRLPGELRARVPAGTEVFLLLPVLVLAGWVSLELGGWVETGLLGGDYRHWLLQRLGVTYDQRNSLVVGIAMGFAVVPLIFTIAEDSLSNVPPHLAAGSLALGATRWQTAVRVVLPTASPGIFSAVMIGFGRAVGETMIVLMATGNTPVMDWSLFNGFRALSANIAVELPEAAQGSTHYRVLFLTALLLFVMTFAVNTVAEVVRLRLRRKYQAYA